MRTRYKLNLDNKSQNIYINIDKYNDIDLGIFQASRQYGELKLFPRVTTRENDNLTESLFIGQPVTTTRKQKRG